MKAGTATRSGGLREDRSDRFRRAATPPFVPSFKSENLRVET